jgi:hypothetical protein
MSKGDDLAKEARKLNDAGKLKEAEKKYDEASKAYQKEAESHEADAKKLEASGLGHGRLS